MESGGNQHRDALEELEEKEKKVHVVSKYQKPPNPRICKFPVFEFGMQSYGMSSQSRDHCFLLRRSKDMLLHLRGKNWTSYTLMDLVASGNSNLTY